MPSAAAADYAAPRRDLDLPLASARPLRGGAGVIGCGFGSASVSPSAQRIASKYIC